MRQADTQIIFSKERSLMNHPCTVAVCHIFVRDNSERARSPAAILTVLLEMLEIIKQRLISLSNQLLALALAEHLQMQYQHQEACMRRLFCSNI